MEELEGFHLRYNHPNKSHKCHKDLLSEIYVLASYSTQMSVNVAVAVCAYPLYILPSET